MAHIRPLEHDDLAAVASLMRARLPGPTADEDFLAATLLDQPWADPDLPSLIACNDAGDVVGFVGAQVRRLRVDDRQLRGVCCSHLVVADDPGAGPAGALLLAKLLAGDQDLTWSDTATEPVLRMWQSYGGHPDHARACDWMLVLSPVRWLGSLIGATARRRPLGREVLPVGALPFQAAGPRLARRAHPGPDPDIASEPASVTAIAEELPALASRLSLRVDHDAGYLDYVFSQIEATRGERLIRRLVRRSSVAVGWYAYLPSRGGTSRVLHVLAREREAQAVVADLIANARSEGSAILAGRLEPHLARPMRDRLAALGFARQPVIHTEDPEIDALLATGASLLTQLDSEWYVT